MKLWSYLQIAAHENIVKSMLLKIISKYTLSLSRITYSRLLEYEIIQKEYYRVVNLHVLNNHKGFLTWLIKNITKENFKD